MIRWSFLDGRYSTWEVIDFLMSLHPCEKIGLDVIIGPAEIECEIGEWLGLQKPFILFGNMLDDSILGICVKLGLPLTLMTSLFFLFAHCAL